VLPVESFTQGDGEPAYIFMATRQGRVKRVELSEFAAVRSTGVIAILLNEGDKLNWAKLTNGQQDVILVTEQGQSIRFHEDEVRVMGRTAAGVNGIRLDESDRVAGMDVVSEESSHMLVVTRYGFGKRTLLAEYKTQGRYGSGIRTLARNEKTGPIVAMRCINSEDEILLLTKEGVVLRTKLDQIRETGRSTQGVTLMNVAGKDEVVGIAIVSASVDDTVMTQVLDGDGTAPADVNGTSNVAESNGATPE
jgi:DNA gyrase subunit A